MSCLIEFKALKSFGCIPILSSHGEALASMLTPLDCIDHDSSIVIFVSHRGVFDPSNLLEESPRPDTPSNDKFILICEAVDRIMTVLAPGMDYCYLWIDCTCTVSSSEAAVPPYEEILRMTDILLTPMYDSSVPNEAKKKDAYIAKPWSHGPEAYLNRSWCRLEILMALATTMADSSPLRRSRLSAAFLYILDRKKRYIHLNRHTSNSFVAVLQPAISYRSSDCLFLIVLLIVLLSQTSHALWFVRIQSRFTAARIA